MVDLFLVICPKYQQEHGRNSSASAYTPVGVNGTIIFGSGNVLVTDFWLILPAPFCAQRPRSLKALQLTSFIRYNYTQTNMGILRPGAYAIYFSEGCVSNAGVSKTWKKSHTMQRKPACVWEANTPLLLKWIRSAWPERRISLRQDCLNQERNSRVWLGFTLVDFSSAADDCTKVTNDNLGEPTFWSEIIKIFFPWNLFNLNRGLPKMKALLPEKCCLNGEATENKAIYIWSSSRTKRQQRASLWQMKWAANVSQLREIGHFIQPNLSTEKIFCLSSTTNTALDVPNGPGWLPLSWWAQAQILMKSFFFSSPSCVLFAVVQRMVGIHNDVVSLLSSVSCSQIGRLLFYVRVADVFKYTAEKNCALFKKK